MHDSITNTLFFSNTLLYDEKYKWIKDFLDNNGVKYQGIPYTRDIWCRDYMPVQIGENKFVSYNYKPDYLVQIPENKKYITPLSELMKWDYLKDKDIIHCDLVLDGGNIVICGDKVILTEKVFRENHLPPYEITERIEGAFGKQVIWIPCDPFEETACRMNGEIPLGHADGMIHPINSYTVLLANYVDYDQAFRRELLARLQPYFKIEELHFNGARTENSWIYINYIQAGDVVFVPVLGGADEEADRMAICQLKKLLYTNKVFGFNVKDLTFDKENGGGALHCISWNVYEPELGKSIL